MCNLNKNPTSAWKFIDDLYKEVYIKKYKNNSKKIWENYVICMIYFNGIYEKKKLLTKKIGVMSVEMKNKIIYLINSGNENNNNF